MKKTQAQLKILGKRHTWEILTHILNGSKYITQIAEETKIPYTTVQHRVTELKHADLVTIKNEIDTGTGKAIKIVRPNNFRLILTPEYIKEMTKEEKGPILRFK